MIDESAVSAGTSSSPSSGLALLRLRLLAFWQHLGRGSRTVIRVLLRVLLVVYFVFCALFLTLRYGVLPNIDQYKSNVEQLATHALKLPVSIGQITASWHGLRPYLSAVDVVVHGADGRAALTLPKVAATLEWWSIAVADLRLSDLEITHPQLDIQRDANGKLYVGGMLIDLTQNKRGGAADWLLAQRQIVIRSGQIRWNDAFGVAVARPELSLQQVDFVLRNSWHQHRAALRATPVVTGATAIVAAPLDLRINFTHPRFAQTAADPLVWKGELYANLQQLDLALWKRWIDYPFQLERGHGSVRAWLQFDRAHIASLTADLNLTNVSTRLQPKLPLLNLKRVDGRLMASEVVSVLPKLGNFSFGRQGHTLALSSFSLETQDGIQLMPTTMRETFIAATREQASNTRITAQALDLAPLTALAPSLPLTDLQQKILRETAPRGRLSDVSVQWRGARNDISRYTIAARFSGFGLNSQRADSGMAAGQASSTHAIPGFDNLTGSISATERGGRLSLDSRQLRFDALGILAEPLLPLEQLKLQSSWDFPRADQLRVQLQQFQVQRDGLSASFVGNYLTSRRQPWLPGTIDLSGKIGSFDIGQIKRYLPAITHEHLHHWLSAALMAGRATETTLVLKGDLKQFPFHTTTGKAAGRFLVAGKIADGRLNYTPGELSADSKAPEWPLLEHINGSFRFDRSRMEIRASSGRTSNVGVSDVQAVIPDLLAPDAELTIDGKAAGALQNFVDFTNHSPVSGWIGGFTENSKGSGNASLNLNLVLPLADMHHPRVRGALQYANNDVVLFPEMPPVRKVNGSLIFTERGLSLDGVKGEFLGGAVTITGGTQADDTIRITANGALTAAGVRGAYPLRVLNRVSGGARYRLMVRVHDKRPDILVESDLTGLGLDFPAPLNKLAAHSLPLKFELLRTPSDDVLIARDEVRMNLGSNIAARYLRQRKLVDKPQSSNTRWQVESGAIAVNVPLSEPQPGLLANLSMDTLDLDAWHKIGAALDEPEAEPATPTALAASGISAEVDASTTVAPSQGEHDGGIQAYIRPAVLAVRATQLTLMGRVLDHVVVGASHQGSAWQANIDSTQASGYLTWHESASGLGRVSARLASLSIPKSAGNDGDSLLDDVDTEIPGLDIVVQNFHLFGKALGRLELAANNARSANGPEWQISRLAITNPDGEFNAHGKWTRVNHENRSNLTYALDIHDAGQLLDRLGFGQALRNGHGRLDGEISWNGLPYALDLPSLTGQIHLDLLKGQFLKLEPGVGKLLGVLSLQSLPRRLTLDFRDIFSQGFAFDGVVGTANIAHGKVTTDSLKMRSVSATVLMDGSADLEKETQNLHVVVIPEINLGAASVLYGLAINPVIGLGSFLAQLFLRDPLMRAFTFEYDVTGPWTDPQVVKLDRRSEAGSPATVPVAPAVPAPPAPPAAAATPATDLSKGDKK